MPGLDPGIHLFTSGSIAGSNPANDDGAHMNVENNP
jgi:hypothetical protein